MADASTRSVLSASLRRTELFREADDAALNELTAATVSRNWVSGEEIFAAGDPSDGLYIVVEGQVRLTLLTDAGAELTVRDAAPGDLFGEIGGLDGGPRSATATAAAKTTTAFLSSVRLADILTRHPAALLDIARKLCHRLRDTTEQLEGIALYPLRQRVARYILAQGTHNGRDRGNGKRSVSIALSQSELGAVLGASRPKINAALNELERSGCIERKGALFHYDVAKTSTEAGSKTNADR